MPEAEKIALIQSLIDDVAVTEGQISAYLSLAQRRILQALYPFGNGTETLPPAYDLMQCELAVRYIARRGGEGEVSHSENGVSRTYGSVDDSDILGRITPFVGVI